MDQLVDIINYDVINFHPDTGVLELYIHELGSTLSIEIPINDNKFLTGDELMNYIAGFIPVHAIQRRRQLANVTNADEFKQFIKESANKETLAKAIRVHRDSLLFQSDWLMLPDAGITNEALQRFLEYRQSLRDIPQQPNFPFDVKWPEVTGEWVNHPEAKQYDDFSNNN